MKKITRFLYFLVFLLSISNSETMTTDEDQQFKRSQHKMVAYWRLYTVLSPIGIFFNGIVLYLFVEERKTLLKSINAMLW